MYKNNHFKFDLNLCTIATKVKFLWQWSTTMKHFSESFYVTSKTFIFFLDILLYTALGFGKQNNIHIMVIHFCSV